MPTLSRADFLNILSVAAMLSQQLDQHAKAVLNRNVGVDYCSSQLEPLRELCVTLRLRGEEL